MIIFLSTSIFWLALWALREHERRRRFESFSEEIETLRANDRRLREENQELRDREQSHLQMIAFSRDRAREIRDGLDLGGKATLQTPATPKAEGLEVNGQHSRNVRKTDYVRLTGPLNSGPAFSGRGR